MLRLRLFIDANTDANSFLTASRPGAGGIRGMTSTPSSMKSAAAAEVSPAAS
jgi:hypothetical protein